MMMIQKMLKTPVVLVELTLLLAIGMESQAAAGQIKVITTISSYGSIAKYIGGDKVDVTSVIKGYQDAHIVRPKPSFALELARADLLVATGLDLEMWLPALMDAAGNRKIMSGQVGYVAASAGVQLIERPTSLDRSEGDVHAFGNPHIYTSPLNGKVIAENIAIGLRKVAPQHADFFHANLKRFKDEIDRRLFGAELLAVLGSKTLCSLAEKGKLYDFLSSKSYKGKVLLAMLGGWMKQALPLRGKKIVTYHMNWGYFARLFGIEVIGYMEPKPGIPPSPGHVASLIERMRREKVRVLFDANYFDIGKIKFAAEKSGAIPVIVALGTGGEPGMESYFDQFDIWIKRLLEGMKKVGAL
jgi:zinc/manganese transport system substrate-binding protein